jgi:hypothetical protein
MPSIACKMTAMALVAGTLALTMAPPGSAETSTPQDTARFLAGLPPELDSPLVALTKSRSWEEHARVFNSIFDQEDKAALSKVRAFSEAHLTDKHDTMLYMFSGPDFLYATSFFPHASTYVMAGLEPVGSVPQLSSLPRSGIDETLRNLEISLRSILNLSFFITRDMKSRLSSGQVYGTLPILYVFLARTGKTIHDVSFVALDKDGNFLTPEDPAAQGAGKRSARSAPERTAKGVKIVFSDGDGPLQTLYYFSTNIADDGVDSSGLLPFCAKLGVADSLFKSASYLMHREGFNKIRNFILNHSATILQDDSGIPLAFFEPAKWRLQPFGRYLGPLAMFRGANQPELAKLFRTKADPLDFGIGYKWRKNESNLLLAQRTGSLAPDGTLIPALTPSEDALATAKLRQEEHLVVNHEPPPSTWYFFWSRPTPPK